ncbi:MAG: hypothetical protein HC821_02010 [Lewinella sp.]|nr:hypothetical protein [Lewinella sp.]
MKTNIFGLLLALLFSTTALLAQNPRQLIDEMMTALGGKQNFYNQGNVSYDYEYTDPNGGLSLQGKETYMFDGELSRGDYQEHSLLGAAGKVVEGYDGQAAWVTFDGKISTDPQANGVARFLRKTNYYWFTMFFKLQDEGVNLEFVGTKKVEGRDYNLVRVTFGNAVGDAQDTYVLYLNQRTKLVDQFLFTVIGFGVKEPNLMKLHYETVGGIKVATERVYVASNWEGEIVGEQWATTYWTNIVFGKPLDKSIFAK